MKPDDLTDALDLVSSYLVAVGVDTDAVVDLVASASRAPGLPTDEVDELEGFGRLLEAYREGELPTRFPDLGLPGEEDEPSRAVEVASETRAYFAKLADAEEALLDRFLDNSKVAPWRGSDVRRSAIRAPLYREIAGADLAELRRLYSRLLGIVETTIVDRSTDLDLLAVRIEGIRIVRETIERTEASK